MPLRAEEGQYGSGTVAGGGFGNKVKPEISPESDASKDDAFRFGTAKNTDPYSGGHPNHGSGSTGGAGFGNKTSDGFGSDSRLGRMMEKAGGMMGNEKMVEKGRVRRRSKGFEQEDKADELQAERKAPL